VTTPCIQNAHDCLSLGIVPCTKSHKYEKSPTEVRLP
jgi:hypothetical protein